MSAQDWRALVSRRSMQDMERVTLSEYLTKSHDVHLGQRLLKWTARLGVSFFSMVAAYTAGDEAEMHVVGATLVGCITGLGGGTINNVMTGVTPVGWMREPSFLVGCITASLVGFYVVPLIDRSASAPGESYMSVKYSSHPSAVRYALESIGLSALTVIGAQQGIVRGLHPLVSSCLGVTVALGGVLRDLMCQRELSLGASSGCQSYAIASFSGAAVYVALREVHVWNCAGSTARLLHGGIPIGFRICLGAGTALAVRIFAWQRKPDGIFSSMQECAEANDASIRALL